MQPSPLPSFRSPTFSVTFSKVPSPFPEEHGVRQHRRGDAGADLPGSLGAGAERVVVERPVHVVRDVEVEDRIVVEVGPGAAAPEGIAEAGLLCDVEEGSVSRILEELHPP